MLSGVLFAGQAALPLLAYIVLARWQPSAAQLGCWCSVYMQHAGKGGKAASRATCPDISLFTRVIHPLQLIRLQPAVDSSCMGGSVVLYAVRQLIVNGNAGVYSVSGLTLVIQGLTLIVVMRGTEAVGFSWTTYQSCGVQKALIFSTLCSSQSSSVLFNPIPLDIQLSRPGFPTHS